MKQIILAIILASSIFAADNNHTNKQIDKVMKQEEKYAKEQKFYQYDEYDFKASEVNQESVKKLKVMEPEYDFDMNSVYD